MENTLKLVICDDNKIFAQRMEQTAERIISADGGNFEIIKFYDGFELVRYCRKNRADILILDIDMPVVSGFEAVEELQKLQPELAVVFVTSHDELAYQAYDYQPFWFVSKSDLDKLDGILKKLIYKIRSCRTRNKTVRLKLNDIVDINTDEAVYLITSRHNYIAVHNADGSAAEFRGTITEAHEQLIPHSFILVQRGLIVNCRFVKRLLAKSVMLNDGTEFPLTRNAKKQEAAREIYGKYMREIG